MLDFMIADIPMKGIRVRQGAVHVNSYERGTGDPDGLTKTIGIRKDKGCRFSPKCVLCEYDLDEQGRCRMDIYRPTRK